MDKIFNLQQLINGIQLGSIYALIAIGYTLVYGIIRLVNFAHGDFYMLGAYAAYFTINFMLAQRQNPYIIFILLVSMLAGALVAFLSNRIAYRKLRYKPRLSALITAIGVSMFLEYFTSAIPAIGPSYRPFPQFISMVNYNIGTAYFTNYQIINVSISIVLMLILTYIIKYTRLGMAMRASAQDKDALRLMGIDLEKIIDITFIVGGALAGAAGLLSGLTYPRILPYMGIVPGLKAFIAAVLGGIGNIGGAVAGAFILGISEVFGYSINSIIGEGIAYAILILVLIFLPQGLFGKRTGEKV
ncbi:MAG: branched-chain amino acid ABC transporter permease [Caldisericaceae bacterium]